jgi:hypothetical protein
VRRWLILAIALLGLAGCAISAPTPVPPELIPAEPVVDCRAPASTCATAVNDARMQVTGGVVPIAVQVVLEGEADIAVRYSDGSTGAWTAGWSGAVPAGPAVAPPPMPVAPTCQGVPEPTCTEMAQAGWESTGGDGVVSIVVRCSVARGCTAARGEGETTVAFADGRTMVTGWGYEGAAP